MAPTIEIDVLENKLRRSDDLLNVLILDRTTGKNLLWGTDSYKSNGKGFGPKDRMKVELVTGLYGKLIQPRAAKSLQEQRFRTKEKAEVFTPLRIIEHMNIEIDSNSGYHKVNKDNWREYVSELKLEICCGEAPFIASRYNPTAHTGKLIHMENRVGFLDRKLRIVSRYCDKPKEWIHWAKVAFKACYGYEWQGDNILIARENLLYTFIDYYIDRFSRRPSVALQHEVAEIISWNIFQMDGIKYVVPMSCKHINRIIPGELTLFGETPDTLEKDECEGCKHNYPTKHNGKYVKVMDWAAGKPVKFVSLVGQNQEHLVF